MGTYTQNLNLYNTNMLTDGNDTFDFQRDLNDNNDKIDSAVGKLSTLSTTTQSSLVGAINEVVSNCGALANLSTTDKTSLVNAINELLSNLDSFATKSLGNLDSTGQAVLDKKIEVEALLQQNGYAKFKWKENNQISKIIVQWGKISTSGNTVVGNVLNLATSYTSNNYCPAVSTYILNPTGSTGYIPVITDITQSSLTFYWANAYANRSFYIITIGY
jgi:hypothetical protein